VSGDSSPGYERRAIFLAVASELLFVAAVAAWLWVDHVLAAALVGFAFVCLILAANSSKASRQSRMLTRYIGDRETVQAELPAMLAGKRGRNNAVRVVLTELNLYLFELHIAPRPAKIRLPYADVLSVRMDAPERPSHLLIELPDQTLDLSELQVAQLGWFEDVLAIARPGLVSGSLADELRAARAD
jgi:hypothetical protein